MLIGIGATILNNARIGRELHHRRPEPVIPEQTIIPPNSLRRRGPRQNPAAPSAKPEDRKLILKYAQNYLDYTAIYLKEIE